MAPHDFNRQLDIEYTRYNAVIMASTCQREENGYNVTKKEISNALASIQYTTRHGASVSREVTI
jgi:hypothetical protein